VILLGVRDDVTREPGTLTPRSPAPSVAKAIAGLPPLRSGLSKENDGPDEWMAAVRRGFSSADLFEAGRRAGDKVADKLTRALDGLRRPRADRGAEFLEVCCRAAFERDWFEDPRIQGVCNHSARGHIAEDLWRYIYAASFACRVGRSPALADFPERLLPSHTNARQALDGSLFADRFRVQLAGKPATTVVSHIAKDGHYYIHPDPTQCRSLSVREAARLQTFPDNYFFVGPRTAQYIQVGNAVPPLLARQIAGIVRALLSQGGASS
jgi:DNA (cytosine-5)-methyltransferase 1